MVYIGARKSSVPVSQPEKGNPPKANLLGLISNRCKTVSGIRQIPEEHYLYLEAGWNWTTEKQHHTKGQGNQLPGHAAGT